MTIKKTEENKETKKEYPKKKKELTYYIGPTVERGLLYNGSVFRGGLPEEIKRLQKKHPAIKLLFVSKKNYIEAVTKIKTQGSKFNILYENAVKGIAGR